MQFLNKRTLVGPKRKAMVDLLDGVTDSCRSTWWCRHSDLHRLAKELRAADDKIDGALREEEAEC